MPISLSLAALATLDRLFPLRLGDADLAELFLLRHIDLGLLHRLRCRLAANRFDVARFVGDVGDVDVDEDQADLAQLRLQRRLDAVQEFLAVAVDVLNAAWRR